MANTRESGRLQDQRCLIVGGTGGIGLATAARFLEEGGRVVISGATSKEADAAAASLDCPEGLLALQADVAEESSIDSLFEQAIAFLGQRLDLLVHVAGISGRRFGDGPIESCTTEGWDHVMRINARGLFFSNRAAIRQMLRQVPRSLPGSSAISATRGAIVNVGSVLGHAPSPEYFDTIAYAASKGAVEALTKASAARYAESRIRLNLVAPGLIDTPMAQRAVTNQAVMNYLHAKQPMASGPGTPGSVAEAILFLGEPTSHFITGVTLDVDGGWRLVDGQLPHETP